MGVLNPMRDKNEGTCIPGGRDNACDHGLSRKSLREKKLETCCVLSWKVKVMIKKKMVPAG